MKSVDIMKSLKKINKNRSIHPSITEARIIDAISRDDGTGFCIECGGERDGCEPDAVNYNCPACSQPEVYGADNVLLMMV